MKKLIIPLILLLVMAIPAASAGIVAPEIPDDVQELLPEEENDFASGLWSLVRNAFLQTQPEVAAALKLCLTMIASLLFLAILQNFTSSGHALVALVGVLAVAAIFLGGSNSLIALGTETVWKISEYGKLLLPVMTAALAAQGGTVSAAAIYGATALFDTFLSSLVSAALIHAVYIYIILSILNAATGDELLKKLKDMMKWAMTWAMKIILYIFTGYISITGIISGTADQTAVKAAKLTISGMVPVVGGILSDASEAVLVGAGVVKNSVGLYGLFAILAITIVPFLTIGLYYLLLKLTAAISAVFAPKSICNLLEDFSGALGLVLGMTGAVCLIQLISVACFLKGMT